MIAQRLKSTSFGIRVCQALGRAKVKWQLLTEKSTNASLKKRDDSSLEACYRDIFREMKQLVDGPETGAEDGIEKSNGKVRHTLPTLL